MKALFIDETGDHSLSKIDSSYPIFVLSGIIVDEDYHNGDLTETLDAFKAKHFGTTDIVLHSKEITHPQSARSPLYMKFMDSDFRRKFYTDFEHLLAQLDISIVACVIMKNKHFANYGLEAKDPYLLSFDNLLNRLVFDLNDEQRGKIYTERPYYGTRRMQYELERSYGICIGRERIRHLMAKLGLEAIYPKPNTSKPGAGSAHEVYPYLLRGLAITRPNQVWGSDITYIRTATGFVYLVAFIDWFSRYVVSWRLSDSLEQSFCLEALDEALGTATPEISNTDQGSHFTSAALLEKLKAKDVQISMDGRGRCMDNIFTERLWRTVKYENVFLQSYQNIQEAQAGLTEYFAFYNHRRPHQSLDYHTPAAVYFGE